MAPPSIAFLYGALTLVSLVVARVELPDRSLDAANQTQTRKHRLEIRKEQLTLGSRSTRLPATATGLYPTSGMDQRSAYARSKRSGGKSVRFLPFRS